MLLKRWALVFLVSWLLPGSSFAADDSYYMLVFAMQDDANQPKHAHAFATFVKATGQGAKAKIEGHTISWMPDSLDIVVLRRLPEPGRNLSLPATLRLAKSFGSKVTLWGPYQIKKELYTRALAQEERLNKRAIMFKTVDRRFRLKSASNCIHAVADIDTDNGILNVGTSYGNAASQIVVQHLSRWIIEPKKTHEWVAKRLSLGTYQQGQVAQVAARAEK
jgi:hypothetical protein